MSVEIKKLESKRFVVRKSLIGKNVVITFVNKKGDKIEYINENTDIDENEIDYYKLTD